MDFEDSQGQTGMLEILRRLKISLKKYWILSWPPAAAIIILSILITIKIPSYYTSEFAIFIKRQEINSDDDNYSKLEREKEQFDALVKQLVSKDRILGIIERFRLYPDYVGLKGREKALKRFENAYNITSVDPILGNSDRALPTFQISFSHQDPRKAFLVTQELENRLIEESLISQRSGTRAAEEFYSAQLKNVQKRLEEIEQKRQEYMRKNANKLPEHREKIIRDQREAHSKISANSQLIVANNSRINYLSQELEMAINDPSSGTSDSEKLGDGASISQLSQYLKVLKSKYSDKHPEVVATKRRIESLKKSGANVKSSGQETRNSNTREARMIRREISELKVQNEQLALQNEELKSQIKEMEKEIKNIPITQKTLLEIERDYKNQKNIYDDLMLKREEASVKADIIQGQKGTRFVTLESASKPQRPSGPPRILIATGGILTGILVFLLIPLLFFVLNQSLKFKKEAENLIGLPVLGVIPPLHTPGIVSSKRRAMFTSFMTSVFTLIVGVALVFIFI